METCGPIRPSNFSVFQQLLFTLENSKECILSYQHRTFSLLLQAKGPTLDTYTLQDLVWICVPLDYFLNRTKADIQHRCTVQDSWSTGVFEKPTLSIFLSVLTGKLLPYYQEFVIFQPLECHSNTSQLWAPASSYLYMRKRADEYFLLLCNTVHQQQQLEKICLLASCVSEEVHFRQKFNGCSICIIITEVITH